MTQTPIYEEVRRTLGGADRTSDRRAFRADTAAAPDAVAEPVTLRVGGGRHRRPGD